MQRRAFLASSALAATSIAATGTATAAASSSTPAKFTLGFGPHEGMFRASAGPDILDQIKFASARGFTAWEDNGLPGRPPELQEKIGQTLADCGMLMGVFVAYGSFDEPTFAVPNKAKQEEVLGRIQAGVEIAKRVGAKWMTVVPGSVDQQSNKGADWNRYGGRRLAPGYQEANVVELLKRCAAVLEPHDLVMVLEPLNWYADHGGTFLRYADQAYAICTAVGSPSCKILFDIYHQQITEGNLIPNIDLAWEEIAYFQAGDNPGRKEPGTGEINYKNVFRHIHGKGFKGVVGMEHGVSIPGEKGEQALIDAYRAVDPRAD